MLVNSAEEFAFNWLMVNCQAQPASDTALTWYVYASTLYSEYSRASRQARVEPVTFNGLYRVLKQVFGGVAPGKIQGIPVYAAIRYLRNGHPCFEL